VRERITRLVTFRKTADTFCVDPRRWWLLAATASALSACAAAAVHPAVARGADGLLLFFGVASAVVMWTVGGRQQRGLRGWRLLALAPVPVAVGPLLAAVLTPADPLVAVVLGWSPAVPGCALAVAGGLTLVGCSTLRGRGRRVLVELLIFTTASVVTMQMLFVGPGRRWQDLAGAERLVLAVAVLTTAAVLAGAATVLGVIEARRRRVALLLLGGSVLLAAGGGLTTSGLLAGWAGGVHAGRACVVLWLALGMLAVLSDPSPGRGGAPRPEAATYLGQVLPHAAMTVGAVVVGGSLVAGYRPDPVPIGGMVLCVALAALHRVIVVREEQLLGARLRRSEAWFRSLVQEGSDAVVILDDDLRVAWSSPALARSLGPAAEALVGTPLLAAVHPEDATGLAEVLPRAGEPGRSDGGSAGDLHVLRLRDADGSWRILEAVVGDLRTEPSVAAVVLHCRDVTERHAREQVLRDVAYTDSVTGLPNRAGCELALQRAVEAPGPPVTLLLVELDGLQAAREDVGRVVARELVSEVGRRLRGTVRAGDLVARIGGGAFAVLAHGESGDPDRDAADVDQLAARCLSVIEQPIMTRAGIVDLTGAIGLARVEPGLSAEDVLNRVELAVRAAHVRAAGTATRWTPALGQAAERRDRLRADLAGAATRGELSLLLEPIVSLAERRIVGVEALLRWQHPVLGDVPRAEFLPLAARAGVAGELGRWLLQEAMIAVVALPETVDPVRLGVDVSTAWAATGTLVADVAAALRMTGLPPERLILEITEATVLADDERISLDLTTLRLMGVHVALEGVGAGYSGLTQLTRLPIDVVKLDRALVTRIDRDPQGRALSDAMIGIGRALGLDVVAEGVETPAQLATLSDSGYGFAQGRVVSRPMTPGELAGHLARTSAVLLPGLVGQR
jgi:PAS domain S-box-containing protein/diguanylate cyclase (GGDEF)-like protein